MTSRTELSKLTIDAEPRRLRSGGIGRYGCETFDRVRMIAMTLGTVITGALWVVADGARLLPHRLKLRDGDGDGGGRLRLFSPVLIQAVTRCAILQSGNIQMRPMREVMQGRTCGCVGLDAPWIA